VAEGKKVICEECGAVIGAKTKQQNKHRTLVHKIKYKTGPKKHVPTPKAVPVTEPFELLGKVIEWDASELTYKSFEAEQKQGMTADGYDHLYRKIGGMQFYNEIPMPKHMCPLDPNKLEPLRKDKLQEEDWVQNVYCLESDCEQPKAEYICTQKGTD
jgi:hypothetical protein